ncbi:MAG TPA: MOSC domain-containing protein [Longimicrobiales bacterium]|nr:MOSC domain-containing protein [Longimicrobiales bacterium]
MKLSRLFVYPVKSLAGIELDAARVDDFGIQHDRRWLVTDAHGIALTQRDLASMTLIRPSIVDAGLMLSAPDHASIEVGIPGNNAVTVTVWNDTVTAQDAGARPAEWLSDFLGHHVRLVYMPDDTFRRVDPRYSPAPRRVSFADAYPFLLVTQESLDELNRRLEQPIGIERFRPNIVVSGAPAPHAEDDWKRIRIGELEIQIVKPCARCAIPTIDPLTGERGKEPTRTLSTYRRRDGKVYFGQNALHSGPGKLSVGEAVEVAAAVSEQPVRWSSALPLRSTPST